MTTTPPDMIETALEKGIPAHLLPPTYKTQITAWLAEDAPPPLRTSIVVMLALAVLNTVLQPLFIAIAVRLWAWAFPLVSFALNGALVLAVALHHHCRHAPGDVRTCDHAEEGQAHSQGDG